MKSVLLRILAIATLLLPAAGASAGACPGGEAECERAVEVRGSQLHVRIRPGGPVAVVFEAGSGLGVDSWNAVFDLLRDSGATLVGYDRAGMGRSDGLDTAYDVYDEVARLHAALQALGVDRQLVLVGHSYGGYLIHLYANLYPGDVRGLVYVDANTVAGIDALGGPGPIAEARIRANDVPDPDKVRKANLRLSRGLVATHETLRRYPVVCGVPVVAVSAGAQPEGLDAAKLEGWRDAHRRLAAQAGGEWRLAEGSGHMIPRDRPDAIASAVADVLARTGDAGARPGRADRPCATGDRGPGASGHDAPGPVTNSAGEGKKP